MKNFYAKYRISEINFVKFELVIRCLYNVMPNVYVYVISKQVDLHFFVTSDDMSQMALLVSKLSIVCITLRGQYHHFQSQWSKMYYNFLTMYSR